MERACQRAPAYHKADFGVVWRGNALTRCHFLNRGGQEAFHQYDSGANTGQTAWRSLMPTSTRYDSIAARLTSALPDLRPRLLEPLACALVGMSQSVSALQRDIAAA